MDKYKHPLPAAADATVPICFRGLRHRSDVSLIAGLLPTITLDHVFNGYVMYICFPTQLRNQNLKKNGITHPNPGFCCAFVIHCPCISYGSRSQCILGNVIARMRRTWICEAAILKSRRNLYSSAHRGEKPHIKQLI